MVSRVPNKQRLADAARKAADADLARQRFLAQNRLKSTWEGIFTRYGRDFTGIADEIDTVTGEVVVDNGHLRSMDDAPDEESEDEDWEAREAARERRRRVKAKGKGKWKGKGKVLAEGGRGVRGARKIDTEVSGDDEWVDMNCEVCRDRDELDDSVCQYCASRNATVNAGTLTEPTSTSKHPMPRRKEPTTRCRRKNPITTTTTTTKMHPGSHNSVRNWSPHKVHSYLRRIGALPDHPNAYCELAFQFEKYELGGAAICGTEGEGMGGGIHVDELRKKLRLKGFSDRMMVWAGILRLKKMAAAEEVAGDGGWEEEGGEDIEMEMGGGEDEWVDAGATPKAKVSESHPRESTTTSRQATNTTPDPWAPPPASEDPFYSSIWRDEHPDGTPVFSPCAVDPMFFVPEPPPPAAKKKRKRDEGPEDPPVKKKITAFREKTPVEVYLEAADRVLPGVAVEVEVEVAKRGGRRGPTARTPAIEVAVTKTPTAVKTPAIGTPTIVGTPVGVKKAAIKTPAIGTPNVKVAEIPTVPKTPAVKVPAIESTTMKVSAAAGTPAVPKTPTAMTPTVVSAVRMPAMRKPTVKTPAIETPAITAPAILKKPAAKTPTILRRPAAKTPTIGTPTIAKSPTLPGMSAVKAPTVKTSLVGAQVAKSPTIGTRAAKPSAVKTPITGARKTPAVGTPAVNPATKSSVKTPATKTPATGTKKPTALETPVAKSSTKEATWEASTVATPATKTPSTKASGKNKTPISKFSVSIKKSTPTPVKTNPRVDTPKPPPTPGWTTSASRVKMHGKSFLGYSGVEEGDDDNDELSVSPVPAVPERKITQFTPVKRAKVGEGAQGEGEVAGKHICGGSFCFVCLDLEGGEDDLA